MKLELKIFMRILVNIEKCLISAIIQVSQNIMIISGKIKHETGGVAIKEFVGLKPKMYSFIVDDSGKYKKAKSVNKNVVEKITHNDYKDVLFNPKCLRHSMNRIQSKDHRLGTYEIHEISLSWFDDKIYTLNNG